LNKVIGVGGIPRGKITEIFGKESSGKSSLTYQIMGYAQKMFDEPVALLDVENAATPEYLTKMGVDVKNNFLLVTPDTGESAFDILLDLAASNRFSMIVVDSVAMMIPSTELEGEMADQQVGLQARMIGKGLRKLNNNLGKKRRTAIVFINQIRSKVGAMSFGPQTDTPGGHSLKFNSSLRIEVTNIGKEKRGDVHVGNNLRLKTVKNKLAPPFRTCQTQFLFNVGFSKELEILEECLDLGIVKKKKTTFFYGDTKLGVGKNQTIEYLKDNSDLCSELESFINQKPEEMELDNEEE